MAVTTYAEALVQALMDAMAADERVSLIGSSPLGLGPQRALTSRIRERFPDRVDDPPTSEAANAALGVGAAMAGMRPFVDLGTGSFAFLAWSQLVNEAAVARYMSSGAMGAPVTFHCLEGVRGSGAPQHSQNLHGMLWNAPGIRIVLPTCPADVYGLVRTALSGSDPTFIMSHAKLLGVSGEAPERGNAVPFGQASVRREGRDVTIVAVGVTVLAALAAAETLGAEGIEAEVIDPRTLVPFDEDCVLGSVARTGRLVVVDEAPLQGGPASVIAGMVAEHGFAHLRAPVARVARADTPVAYAPGQEAWVVPDQGKIEAAVRRVVRWRAEAAG
jgi:acetoin:2,6-dichlorophenolindophenol oxidoreductase subunit beta